MPFTIPNEADAGNTNQAEPDAVDFDILTFGLNRTAVLSGCAVTAQGTPDMTVAVGVGAVEIAGEYVAVTAGNGTITAADGSNPRFDLVTINTSGTIVVTAGTAAASPVFPAHPANVVVLAAVYVAANDTAIGSTEIVDKRMLNPGGIAYTRKPGRWYQAPISQSTYSTSSGDIAASVVATDGKTFALPFPVGNAIDVVGYGVHVVTASDAAAPRMKFCVYEDVGGFPGAVVTGSVSGTVDISSTGGKSVTITAVTLKPGMYWIGLLCYDTDDGSVIPFLSGHSGNVLQYVGSSTLPASNNLAYSSWLHDQAAATATFPDPWTSTTSAFSSSREQIRMWVQTA